MDKRYIDIEDKLSQAFVLSLGTELPEPKVFDSLISFIDQKNQKEGLHLSADYVYSGIVEYINHLCNGEVNYGSR